jgi:O-methyltransferase involved in polyketide biosynthesis
VILDVLHYVPRGDQEQVLERVRDALSRSGTLLLRVGDADGGFGFRWSTWVDRTVMRIRGHGAVPLHCRPATEWKSLLARLGFTVSESAMSQGTLFANVLFVGRLG